MHDVIFFNLNKSCPKAPLPSKPQAVLIERWLPYSQAKRRVIFQRSNERDPMIVKPRNVIIQWEAPQVIKQ